MRWITVAGAMLVIIVALMISHTADLAQVPLPPLTHSKYDERLTTLDREAVDEAYRTQIVHLFLVWMKDDRAQPQRAMVGLRNARKAYVDAMMGIEAREKKPAQDQR
jgi:hypothetical protein